VLVAAFGISLSDSDCVEYVRILTTHLGMEVADTPLNDGMSEKKGRIRNDEWMKTGPLPIVTVVAADGPGGAVQHSNTTTTAPLSVYVPITTEGEVAGHSHSPHWPFEMIAGGDNIVDPLSLALLGYDISAVHTHDQVSTALFGDRRDDFVWHESTQTSARLWLTEAEAEGVGGRNKGALRECGVQTDKHLNEEEQERLIEAQLQLKHTATSLSYCLSRLENKEKL
jgi:hypothetical protein